MAKKREGILDPQEVLEFLVSCGGKTTNMEIVKHFSHLFQNQHAATNKEILKQILHHVVTIRRQGTTGSVDLRRSGSRVSEGRRAPPAEGKLIILKKRFKNRNGLDIWSSLLLSLSREELDALIKDPPPPEQHVVVLEESPGAQPAVPQQEDLIKTDSTHHTEAMEDEDEVFEERSVKDLSRTFNELANTSSVSLKDLIRPQELDPKVDRRRRGPVLSEVPDFTPLTVQGKQWLAAAARMEYTRLAKMAADDPQLVHVRYNANGYTALHLAARNGRGEVVKLLAGTYNQNPDVRTRGGYTPLMLSGIWKHHEVYRLLVETYNAKEELRDNSGHTAPFYLENHIQVPGFPPTMDMSHDVRGSVTSIDDVDSRFVRGQAARSSTQILFRDVKDSIRDSFREGLRHGIREKLVKTRNRSTSSVQGD